MADVIMRPVLVLAVACGGCGERVKVLPFEHDELIELHLLEPRLTISTVMHLEGERNDGWHLTYTTALCPFCWPVLADSTAWASTGPFVPVPSWTPLCDGAGCGAEGFLLNDELEPVPLIVHQPALTNDDLAALAASEWSTSGRLLCPACISHQETRLFEALTYGAGMDPLFDLEVHRG